jgi:hypothetical protein
MFSFKFQELTQLGRQGVLLTKITFTMIQTLIVYLLSQDKETVQEQVVQ